MADDDFPELFDEPKAAGTGIRIALLTHSTNPRGGVVHAAELGDALHDQGHPVTLYAPDASGRGLFRATRCAFHPVPATPCSTDLVALVRQRITDYINWFESPHAPRHHVYHAQDSISANALATLTERGVIPGFIRTVHHLDAFDHPQLTAWQTRGFMSASRVLCVSELWRDRLAQDYGVNARLVSNGVDTARFNPVPDRHDREIRDRLALGNGPILLAVGGVEPRKNTIAILDAFLRFKRVHASARLVIAGGASLLDHGSYHAAFNALVRSSGIDMGHGKSLILTGTIADAEMPALFRSADALVFPSLREGFGLVVLEAMACGTPAVVSRIAPFTEYLGADSCAWVDPANPALIAEGIAHACDPVARTSLREAGFAVCAGFGWQRSAVTHLNHYQAHIADRLENAYA